MPDISHCKICGCQDPTGPLPEHLSDVEMRIIVQRFNFLIKEIADKISVSKSAIATSLNGHIKSRPTHIKFEKYLLKILIEKNHE
jgi:predicted DNA-binding protein YlxM (UPF0122 family)